MFSLELFLSASAASGPGLAIKPNFRPALVSSVLALMLIGFLFAWMFTKFGILDTQTAYFCTTLGSLSALVGLSPEGQDNATLILCFHFFRLLSVILVALFILKYVFP